MIAIPSLVIAANHGFPIRKKEARNFALPRLDAAAMLANIRTYRFDFDDSSADSQAHVSPGVARQRAVIHGVADNVTAQGEIVLRHGVGSAVACVLYRSRRDCGFADRLFNGIDPQPHSSGFFRQRARDR